MAIGETIAYGIGLAASFLGLSGLSHSMLRKRIDEMDKLLSERPTDQEVRTLIIDKLAPYGVETYLIKERINELRLNYKDLDSKLDKVLDICMRIQNERK